MSCPAELSKCYSSSDRKKKYLPPRVHFPHETQMWSFHVVVFAEDVKEEY